MDKKQTITYANQQWTKADIERFLERGYMWMTESGNCYQDGYQMDGDKSLIEMMNELL